MCIDIGVIIKDKGFSFPILPFPFLSSPIKIVKESQWPCLHGLVLASQGVAKPPPGDYRRKLKFQAQAQGQCLDPLFCFCFCLETATLFYKEMKTGRVKGKAQTLSLTFPQLQAGGTFYRR